MIKEETNKDRDHNIARIFLGIPNFDNLFEAMYKVKDTTSK